jgi:tetratricopeptide (TPR) repeat protein
MDPTARKFCFAVLLALSAGTPALAQLGDELPGAAYFLAKEAFYSGDYQDAERALRRETQRGVRSGHTRWIDAICHHAMLGEVLYHEGRHAEALANFDQACQMLLVYPNWLLQVKFQQPPRPDSNRARRIAPWGQSERNFVPGQFAETEQVLVGEFGSAERALQRGGVVSQPMYWRVNVFEVVRCSALAIRRRSEILGPLAAHDPLSKELSAKLAGGNLAPLNHWSGAWIDLLRGAAQAGVGKFKEADTLLERSLIIEGRYDHPLTCVAFLEQGRIAMKNGDSRRAATLLAEAGFSAYYFEDLDVLTESVQLGWLNHIASNSPGVYPPLEPVAAWAQLNRLQHITVKLRLALAESLLWQGQLDAASAALEDVSRRLGPMRNSLSSVHLLYVQAAAQLMRGKIGPGNELLLRALTAQANVSPRNFQIGRTNEMYDKRMISPRVAVDVYPLLLGEPPPLDWVLQPADTMAVLSTPHGASFDRWFMAAMERKEPALALEVGEKAKRRKFLSAQPLGGRILSLRTLLESPEGALSRDALMQRQQIQALFPAYRTLEEAGRKTQEQLRSGPVFAEGNDVNALALLYENGEENAAQRELLLSQIAVRRMSASTEFPPLRSTDELKKSVGEGEALVIFHSVGGNLFGFLISTKDTVLWPVRDPRRLRADISELLQAMGNYGPTKQLSLTELESNKWRDISAKVFAGIFADARLDLAKTTSLIIVPDDVLWYLPFEALVPDASKPDAVLADSMLVRYGPTASLAISNLMPLRRVQHTGIVATQRGSDKDAMPTDEMLDELTTMVTGPVRVPAPLPYPSRLVQPLLDVLINFDDIELKGDAADSLLPAARGKGKNADGADSWTGLPYGAPERVIASGFSTASEQGLKGISRRGAARGPRPGDEIFQTLCSLMSDGTRTILISRWRTNGRTNFELMREFAREVVNRPANEAWQRACLLARETPLEPAREPRLKKSNDTGEPPTADHPIFWSGYLLVDNSPSPAQMAEEAEAEPVDETAGEPAAPAEGAKQPVPPPGGKDAKAEQPPPADGDAPAKSDEPALPPPADDK